MNKPLTPTQLAVQAWQAKQGPFTGHITTLDTTAAARRQAKAKLRNAAKGH